MNGPLYGSQFNAPDMSEAIERDENAPAENVERAIPVERVESNGRMTGLLDDGQAERLRARWNEIQAKFVDEPRSSVSEADALVSEVIQQILQKFNNEVHSLESQWNKGDEISTEDLRQVLQHYRSFFNHLVI